MLIRSPGAAEAALNSTKGDEMLEEYITAYEKAEREGKKSTMMMIERQLQSIGMDRASLLAIVQERKKERRG